MGRSKESLSYRVEKVEGGPKGSLPVAVVWGRNDVDGNDRRKAVLLKVFGPNLGQGIAPGIFAKVYHGVSQGLRDRLKFMPDDVVAALKECEVFELLEAPQDVDKDGVVISSLEVGSEKDDPVIATVCRAVAEYVGMMRQEQEFMEAGRTTGGNRGAATIKIQ